MKVRGNRVLVYVEQTNNKTSNGFIIPKQEKTDVKVGEVIEIGDGNDIKDFYDKKGERIVFRDQGYNCVKVNLRGFDNYFLVDANDILGILNNEEDIA